MDILNNNNLNKKNKDKLNVILKKDSKINSKDKSKHNIKNDSKDISKENWLLLLNQEEISTLENYLFSLNNNINWHIIIEKHLSTSNEKFIKQIKSLIWEDHPSGIFTEDYFEDNYVLNYGIKIKNSFDHISNLFDTINFSKKVKILKPDFNYPLPEMLYDYYNKIINEYEFFFSIFNINHEYVENFEENEIKSNVTVQIKSDEKHYNLLNKSIRDTTDSKIIHDNFDNSQDDIYLLLGYLTKKINYKPFMKLNYDFPIKYNLRDIYNKFIMLIFVNINSDSFDFTDYEYNFLNIKL